jgi:hypothetical protein
VGTFCFFDIWFYVAFVEVDLWVVRVWASVRGPKNWVSPI